jgi:hypothetical protein
MKEPRDFPKALWAVTICEVVVFTLWYVFPYSQRSISLNYLKRSHNVSLFVAFVSLRIRHSFEMHRCWKSVHHCPRIRVASTYLQKNCILIRNSDHSVPRIFVFSKHLFLRGIQHTHDFCFSRSLPVSFSSVFSAIRSTSTPTPSSDGAHGLGLLPSPGWQHSLLRRSFLSSVICSLS